MGASEAVVAGGLVRLPRQAADVEVVVDGSKATINGVVEEAEARRCIVESVESLDSISEVEDNLRPPAA